MPDWRIRVTDRSRWRALAIAATVALFALPVAFMLIGAVHTIGLPPSGGYDWRPNPITWGNFAAARDLIGLDRSIAQSLLVATIGVPISIVVASMTAFAIVMGNRRTRAALLAMVGLALMIPPSALWVPRFALYDRIGLTDTIWPLVAPALVASTPLAVLVFTLAYWRIPRTVIESALVDGVRPSTLWWRVFVPLGRSATPAVGLLAFLFHWSSYAEPLLFVSSPAKVTAAVDIAQLEALDFAKLPIALAGAVLFTLPALLVFLASQRSLLAAGLSHTPKESA